MSSVEFEIDFDPVPWASPKLGRGHHVYDIRDRDKSHIRYLIRQAYDLLPIPGYVVLHLMFFFPLPASASKKKRAQMLAGLIMPTKCDTTNCQKLFEDCLKGHVFEDDRFVVGNISFKHYAEKGSVIVRVTPYQEFFEKMEHDTQRFIELDRIYAAHC
jgi:Holliday junction resolvase RusA-like endonuclease